MQKILLKRFCNKRIFICLVFCFIYSITVQAQLIKWTGNINTNWNNSDNWSPKRIPSDTDAVSIISGLTNYPVISNADAAAASILIKSGASLKMNGDVVLSIGKNGSINNHGVFNVINGSVKFEDSGTVSGTVKFDIVIINGVVDLGSACTVKDKLQINANSSLINHSPVYSDTALLFYNTKALTPTGMEWIADNDSVGLGVPPNITISNSTNVALEGDHTVPGTLQVNPNNKLSIQNNTLTLNGNIKGTGVIRSSSRSNLIINGSGAFGTLYFDETTNEKTNVLNRITINRDLGTVTVANKLNLLGTYKPSAGVLHTLDTIVFKSYSTQTARIDKGSATGGYLTGIAQVERFIPAKRTWRFLTIPVVNDTMHIRTAWQEGVNNTDLNYADNLNPHPGYGTHISGDNDVSKGFDLNTQPNASLRTWDKSVNGWNVDAPPTISTAINDYAGYFIFVRGSRAVDLSQGTLAVPDSTRLRASGFLNTGDITTKLSGSINDVMPLGNPYVSSIDLSKVIGSATNISGGIKFWVWDPKLNFNGGYVVYDNGSSTASYSYANAAATKILQSGEAFLVQISKHSSTVTFHESDKVSTQFNVFGKSASSNAELHANLMGLADDTLLMRDATTVQYNSKYSDTVDDFDAIKIWNLTENMALVRGENTLAIELRPIPQNNDTLFYRLYLVPGDSYTLQIYSQNLPVSMSNALLVDKYLNTQTPLNFNDTLLYNFNTVNGDTDSYRNRFMIVFTSSSPKSTFENLIAIKTTKENGSISLYPNPVSGNKIQLQFQNMNNSMYDVFVYDAKGQEILNREITCDEKKQSFTISLNKSLTTGAYTLNVVDKNSKEKTSVQFVIDR